VQLPPFSRHLVPLRSKYFCIMYYIIININVCKNIKSFNSSPWTATILKWCGKECWEHCGTIYRLFHVAFAPRECVCSGRMEINFDSDFLSLALCYLLKCLSPIIFYSAGSGSSFNSSCFVTFGGFTRLELFLHSMYSSNAFYNWPHIQYNLWHLVLAEQCGNV
jgi:hypothetical protein